MTLGPTAFAFAAEERGAPCGVAGVVAPAGGVPEGVSTRLPSGWADVDGWLAGTLAGGLVVVEGLTGGLAVVVAGVLGGTTMGVLTRCSRTRREWRKSA